jgi:hypothetical protein
VTANAEVNLVEETRLAVAALTHRLRHRAADTDDEVFALEFVTAMRGRGWRPTAARPAPHWQQDGSPADEQTVKSVLDELHDSDWYRKAHQEGGHDDAA